MLFKDKIAFVTGAGCARFITGQIPRCPESADSGGAARSRPRHPAIGLAVALLMLAASDLTPAQRSPDGVFPGTALLPASADTLQPGEVPLPPGYLYPNGIARASDGSIFVGLVTSGQVLRRTPDGGWSLFFPGSDDVYAGTSLRLDEARGLLWGASPDFLPGARARPHRVFALDSRTGEVRRTLTLPDRGFGNDLALAADGTVYVTDSHKGRVLRLLPGSERFEILIDHPDLKPVNGIGAGGIALAADARLVVGNFGAGHLHVVEIEGGGAARLRPLNLPRRLENPDGLAFAPDGSLLVLEAALRSGDGKLLRVPDPFASGARSMEVIRDGLPSPLNLTVAPEGRAYISLSRIRHRLLPGAESSVPDAFGVLAIEIAK